MTLRKGISVLAAFGLAVPAAAFGASSLLEPSACGRFEFIRCLVELDPGGERSSVSVFPGHRLCSGESVTTMTARARARWIMPDGSSLELLPESSARLESFDYDPATKSTRARFRLLRGGLLLERPQAQLTEPALDDSYSVDLGALNVVLKGQKTFLERRGSAAVRIVAFKGTARLELPDGGRATVAENEELNLPIVAKRAGKAKATVLSKDALREADLALHEPPGLKQPAPTYSCEPFSP